MTLVSTEGNAWLSTAGAGVSTGAFYLRLDSGMILTAPVNRAFTWPVRCLQAFALAIFGRTEPTLAAGAKVACGLCPARRRKTSGLFRSSTRNTENATLKIEVSQKAFCVFRSPCSDLLVTAFRVPAGYYLAGGYRRYSVVGALLNVGTWGYHWSSSSSVSTAGEAYDWYFAATGQQAHYVDHARVEGMSVRCLQAFAFAIFGRTEPTLAAGAEVACGLCPARRRKTSKARQHGTRDTKNRGVAESVLRVPFSVFRFISDCFSRPGRLLSGRRMASVWRRFREQFRRCVPVLRHEHVRRPERLSTEHGRYRRIPRRLEPGEWLLRPLSPSIYVLAFHNAPPPEIR